MAKSTKKSSLPHYNCWAFSYRRPDPKLLIIMRSNRFFLLRKVWSLRSDFSVGIGGVRVMVEGGVGIEPKGLFVVRVDGALEILRPTSIFNR